MGWRTGGEGVCVFAIISMLQVRCVSAGFCSSFSTFAAMPATRMSVRSTANTPDDARFSCTIRTRSADGMPTRRKQQRLRFCETAMQTAVHSQWRYGYGRILCRGSILGAGVLLVI